MAGLRRFLQRIVSAVRQDRAEDDLAREVASHLALLEEQFRNQGMSPDEARLAARRAFGGVEQVKEHHRDARAFRWIGDARRDVSYACRTLARAPGFSAVAVATLALGIGATTAIYSLFDAVLLRPLAVDRPHELRVVKQIASLGKISKETTYLPHEWFVELRSHPEVFSAVTAFAEGRDAIATVNGRQSRLIGGAVFVADNYFEFLGVTATAGRVFTTDAPDGANRLVVISDAMRQREFGAARDPIGAEILINRVPFTVIGVTPASFTGLEIGQLPDVYLPLDTLSIAQPAAVNLSNRATWQVLVIGRLPAGVSDIAAGERLTTVRDFMLLPRLNGTPAGRHSLHLLPLETGLSDVRERFTRPLTLLLAMGSLLLLIACANVATLLGARAASRRAEIVIRTTMGAGKSRLMRQLLTESLVLAGFAGVLGAVGGSWATQVLFDLLPQDANPVQLDIAMDRRVLAFTVAISLVTALIAGVVPALRSVGFDLASALRDRSRGGARAAHGRPFAVAQIALATILVVASTMFARTVYNLTTVDLGFDPDHLLQVFVAPGERQYQGPELAKFYRTAYERLRAIPGVVGVTSAQMQLFDRGRTTGTVDVAGWEARPEDEREVQVFQVGPTYFGTTGMHLLRGRDFTEEDVAGAGKVAAINDVLARRFFGEADPIGQTISSGGTYQIVGIVRTAKYNSIRDEDPPALFVPYTTVRSRPRITYILRTAGADQDIARLAASAARVDDELVPIDLAPVTSLVGRSMGQERLLAALSSAFAISALLLLAIGLYGIMTFWVTERTAEIGIHLALGAELSRVRWVVIRQPLWLALLGLGIGLPAALAGARVLDGLLFGINAIDPAAIAASVLLILVVAVGACLLPARRAARIDPMTALRCE
jgi:predicted permease